jgi:hypothetical protein
MIFYHGFCEAILRVVEKQPPAPSIIFFQRLSSKDSGLRRLLYLGLCCLPDLGLYCRCDLVVDSQPPFSAQLPEWLKTDHREASYWLIIDHDRTLRG